MKELKKIYKEEINIKKMINEEILKNNYKNHILKTRIEKINKFHSERKEKTNPKIKTIEEEIRILQEQLNKKKEELNIEMEERKKLEKEWIKKTNYIKNENNEIEKSTEILQIMKKNKEKTISLIESKKILDQNEFKEGPEYLDSIEVIDIIDTSKGNLFF